MSRLMGWRSCAILIDRKKRDAVKRKTLVVVCIVIALFVLTIAIVSEDKVLRHFLSSEKIGAYERAAMRACDSLEESSVVLIYEDTEVEFPLPNGAVPFENEAYPVPEGAKQYLSTSEAFWLYLDELLPQYGYEPFQEGAWVMVSNSENAMQVGIDISVFTSDFTRFHLYQMPWEKG